MIEDEAEQGAAKAESKAADTGETKSKFTWMDILKESSNLQDFNFLVTLGVRF